MKLIVRRARCLCIRRAPQGARGLKLSVLVLPLKV